MKFVYLISALLSVWLIQTGIVGVYRYEHPRDVIYGLLSFIGVILFLGSVVVLFIPGFFAV